MRIVAILTCLSVVSITSAGKKPTWETDYGNQVFKVYGKNGAKSVTTHVQADKICSELGGQLADPLLMRSTSLQSSYFCSGCGWVAQAGKLKAIRSVCGAKEESDLKTGVLKRMFVNCADDPSNEPDNNSNGYNVFCRSEAHSWNAKVLHYYKTHQHTKMLFSIEGPKGPKTIATYEEAEKICKTFHAEVANFWRLKDAIKLKHRDKCGGCGWLMRTGNVKKSYKNHRPICGKKEKIIAEKNDGPWIIPCADDPKDEGKGLEGYDVYCYGQIGPEVPGDAAPVNYKGRDGVVQGYVFAVEHGRGLPLDTRSLAATLCETRLAILATALQVRQAWYNGLSECTCGWMKNWCGISMNDDTASCGEVGNIGCPYGTLTYAYCFVNAWSDPVGPNLVDFQELNEWAYPAGIQEGAVQVSGGYVFMSKASTGNRKARDLFAAKDTCERQGGQVATLEKLKEAKQKGYQSCECAWAWVDVEEDENTEVLVKGGDVKKCCPGGVKDCPSDNPEGGGAGYNIHCYVQCPWRCPPAKNWNIPPRSVKIKGGRVFHVKGDCDKYCLNKEAASEKCEEHKGVLATMQQLEAAQENGFSRCRCGWLADGSKMFPIARISISGCGNDTGVFECPGVPDIPVPTGDQSDWDAYCFISDENLNSTPNFDNEFMEETEEDFVSNEGFIEVQNVHRGNKPAKGYKKTKTDSVKAKKIADRLKREEEARKRRAEAREAKRKARMLRKKMLG